MTSSGHLIRFGKQEIRYSLSFSARKQLKITVFPDGRIAVDAPEGRSRGEVQRVVKKRVRWIVRQRRHFEKYQPLPTPRRYVSGETHRYLGKQYRLRVRHGSEQTVKLNGGFLWAIVSGSSGRNRARLLVEEWYSTHAAETFERRLAICHGRVKHYGIPYPSLRIRKMRTRWGSCRKNGTIVLNPELVRLPTPCIDYLIIHELCHLKFHNHSRGFYDLLSKCLPDWATRREQLNLTAVQC